MAGKEEPATSVPGKPLKAQPDFIQPRIELFEKLKAEYEATLRDKDPTAIKVALPDGTTIDGEAWRTTPYELSLKTSAAKKPAVIAKVNGVLWDLDRPLEEDCQLQFIDFNNDEGRQVFWHSSAHILGEAIEQFYGGHLCYGPPIEQGYFYDFYHDKKKVSSNDFPDLQEAFEQVVSENQPFERLEMKKEDLLEMFKYNEFKCRIIENKIDTATTTVYRCGPLIDLCRGPHVRHTGVIKAAMITKNSATNWEGDVKAESLQRVYGISFPDKPTLEEWRVAREEAAKRDHRKIGKEQQLYFFHELSPGSCFFLPHGAHIYNTLTAFIREEYHKRGYQEVISPNIYNSKLWVTSGHWDHYADNMFKFEIEKETFALKPMNCPGHCLMFAHRPRSWRELPLRMADFGVLHRNEISGALSGLTRVRRFQQDDAHIFCMEEQISEEIKGCLDFLMRVYSVFGFTFKLYLSTRPENFMGEPALWDRAEKQLQESLDAFQHPWELNEGDGAFYGPKIDIVITDALKRPHQCATIQLDFQLPERFNLFYNTGVDGTENERKRPVIVHRAMLGSVERMIGILTESYGGKWPFWLSPYQIAVIPVSSKTDEYAEKVHRQLHEAGFMVDVDKSAGNTLNKKIRHAQMAQYNYIFVVGESEESDGTVNIRTREKQVLGARPLEAVVSKLLELKTDKGNKDIEF